MGVHALTKLTKTLSFASTGTFPAVVFDDRVRENGLAVGAECTGQTDALHGIAEQQRICVLRGRLGGDQVDLSKMWSAFGRQVEIDGLGELR